MTDPKSLRSAVEAIAREAGAAIMGFYNDGAGKASEDLEIINKADGSEVTSADYAAEKIILAALAKLTPKIPVVCEERVAEGATPDVSGGTFWTVDPLDGTKEFLNRTGAFVVAIGLVVDNKPVLGVIYHPAMDLMYAGCGGKATKVDSTGIRKPLGAGTEESKELRVLVNEPHANMKNIKGYLKSQFGTAARIDSKSGILRACQVAESLAALSVYESAKDDGRTAWWDVAPGHAIIEAAGGKVETLEGKPLEYKLDDRKDYKVPPHVAFSPQHVRKAAQSARPAPPQDGM
jgi:3'(2'), 5'-bisphosphate nucleotidase